MSFFRMTEGDEIVADFRVNGPHHVTYKSVVIPVPLTSTPLRNRQLDPTVFAGPKLKIERARSLISELYAVLDQYLQSKPLDMHERPDSNAMLPT